MPVAGTATVDGKPIYRGSLSFRSASGSGPSMGTGISDGQFRMLPQHGLAPGDYLVTIQALRLSGRKVRDPLRGDVDEIVPIPLRVETLPVSVSPQNAQHLAFELSERTSH